MVWEVKQTDRQGYIFPLHIHFKYFLQERIEIYLLFHKSQQVVLPMKQSVEKIVYHNFRSCVSSPSLNFWKHYLEYITHKCYSFNSGCKSVLAEFIPRIENSIPHSGYCYGCKTWSLTLRE